MTQLYLVDDHPIMRECLRALLEVAGHTVVGESADPTEALASLLRLQPEVLVLDLCLGTRSGLELLAELQRRHLSTRIVILTSSTQPHLVAEALRLGAIGYVLKESAGTELMRAINAAVQDKIHLGTGVADLALQALNQPQGDNPLHALTPRERQIMTMVAQGQSSAKIGLALHLAPTTIDTYRSRLMVKLGVNNATSLVRLAVRFKLIDAEAF